MCQLLKALLEDYIFMSALGSAIGGFFGVLIFYWIRLSIEKRHAAPRLIKTYLCGNECNQGQATESEGELMHHHGRRIINQDELGKLEINYPVWEWTKEPTGKGKGDSTIYGPYSSDFSKPGTYLATFRVKALGLSPSSEITNDLILVHLDVFRTTKEYLINNGEHHAKSEVIAIKYIRASELAAKGWVDFKLPFYSDARGIWEYRFFVNDGMDSKPNNIDKFGTNVRVFFDDVKIYRTKEIYVPEV
jgi:hypothetical protein